MEEEIDVRMNKFISQNNVKGSPRIQKHVCGRPDLAPELSRSGNVKLGDVCELLISRII